MIGRIEHVRTPCLYGAGSLMLLLYGTLSYLLNFRSIYLVSSFYNQFSTIFGFLFLAAVKRARRDGH